MGGAKQRKREIKKNGNITAQERKTINGQHSVELPPEKKPDGQQTQSQGTAEMLYARAVNNEDQSGCIYPRNLASHLRQSLYGGYMQIPQRPSHNEKWRSAYDKGKAIEKEINVRKPIEEFKNLAMKSVSGDPYVITSLGTDTQHMEIAAETLHQVLKQLPPPPKSLQPGKCLKNFNVDTGRLGRRSDELQKVGLTLFTASQNPSRHSVTGWAHAEWECNIGVQIVQIRVLATSVFLVVVDSTQS
jgi:hypothetical protein